MTQDVLLLLALALIGAAAVGWTRRLAPLASEFPLKTLAAAAAAGAVVAATLAGVAVAPSARWLALAAGLAWVAGPLALPTLARAGLWRLADALVMALYWSAAGRDAARRLLAQVALQRGDGEAALARLPSVESEAMAAQAHALRGDWAAVLAIELPPGRAGAAGRVARVEALLASGRLQEAAAIAGQLRREVETAEPDPIAYRAMVLAEVMVDAETGNLRRVQEALRTPPAGVPPEVWYGLVARAAEQAGEAEAALKLHAEAYRVAAPARRARHARALENAGRPLPMPLRAAGRSRATLAMVAVIGLAYAGQELLDRVAGSFPVGGFTVDASSIAAAFVLGVPDFPAADAAWRFLAYAFVHGNLLHVGFNLWVLFDLGRMVEARRGALYLVAAFTVGTAMGAYLTTVAQAGATVLLVGASGGVLGVAGALLADVSRRRDQGDRALLGSLLQWMLLIGFISLAIPNVSLWGHVGGVIGGLLWGFARQGLPADRRIDLVAGAAGALALAWALGQALRVASLLL
jgi:membrane associated rhomboid family serine protease